MRRLAPGGDAAEDRATHGSARRRRPRGRPGTVPRDDPIRDAALGFRPGPHALARFPHVPAGQRSAGARHASPPARLVSAARIPSLASRYVATLRLGIAVAKLSGEL